MFQSLMASWTRKSIPAGSVVAKRITLLLSLSISRGVRTSRGPGASKERRPEQINFPSVSATLPRNMPRLFQENSF